MPVFDVSGSAVDSAVHGVLTARVSGSSSQKCVVVRPDVSGIEPLYARV